MRWRANSPAANCNYDRGGTHRGLGPRESPRFSTICCAILTIGSRPPKSAGREQYGAEFVSALKQSRLQPMPDLIATATVLTAATIAQRHRTRAMRRHAT